MTTAIGINLFFRKLSLKDFSPWVHRLRYSKINLNCTVILYFKEKNGFHVMSHNGGTKSSLLSMYFPFT